MHELGITAGAAAPILVDAELWGVLAAMTLSGSVASGLEHHLAEFAEIAATAVASAHARDQLRELVEEQAAVRRVAELVAHGTGQTELFDAVAAEAAGLIHGEAATTLVRFTGDRTCTILATHNGPTPVGSTVEIHADEVGVVRGSCGQADRRGGTTTAQRTRIRTARPTTASDSVWASRSPSTTGCGACSASRPRVTSCRRTPSIVCNRSPSSFPRRSRMPRALPSSRRPVPGSSRPATKPAVGCNATCTTEPSNGWCRRSSR